MTHEVNRTKRKRIYRAVAGVSWLQTSCRPDDVSAQIVRWWRRCYATSIRQAPMRRIGGTAKTQSQNLRQYKRIAVAAGVDRGKIGNGITQPTFGAPGGRALTKLVTAWALAVESGAASASRVSWQ